MDCSCLDQSKMIRALRSQLGGLCYCAQNRLRRVLGDNIGLRCVRRGAENSARPHHLVHHVELFTRVLAGIPGSMSHSHTLTCNHTQTCNVSAVAHANKGRLTS